MDDKANGFFIAGSPFTAPPLAAGLHIVSTPIGNLRDITVRALETLAAADLVLCEDTRHSATLLDHYGIRTARRSLHEHNERERVSEVVALIHSGKAVALISDAGTPLLSDPGFPLVRGARDAGVDVFAVPGPSALLAALAIAGLPTDSFSFIGFLPAKFEAREQTVLALAPRRETLVFYESPRRLGEMLAALARQFGDTREAAVALELTKRFERVKRGTLAELAETFTDAETKGEAVVVVAGAEEREIDVSEWRPALAELLKTQPLRGAVDDIAARYGLKRKEVYDAALALRQQE